MITGAVAAATFALALGEGGYYPTGYSIAALVCWALVLVGLAAGIVPRSEPPRPAVLAGALLAALAALTALSLAWATDRGAAFEEAVLALAYTGLFTLVVLASARGEAAAWLRGLAIGLAAVAALALLNRLEPALFEAERVTEDTLLAGIGRLSWPVGYWNGLGAAMAGAIVLLTWLGGSAATRWGRTLAVTAIPVAVLTLYMTTSRGGMIAAVLGLAVLLAAGPARVRPGAAAVLGVGAGLVLVALVADKSELLDRPGTELAAAEGADFEPLLLVGLVAVAAVAYAWDPLVRRLRPSPPAWLRDRRVLVAAGIVALACVAAGAVAADPGERWDEFKRPPTAADLAGSAERDVLARGSSSGRYQFWSAAVEAFEHNPIGGLGAGGYEAWWNREGELGVPARNGHSLFFDTLAELGLVGALLVVALVVVVAVAGVRRWLAHVRARTGDEVRPADRAATGAALAVFAAGLVGVAGDWTWELPAVFGPVVIAAALITGPATRVDGGEPVAAAGERRSRRRFAAGVVVLAVAWVSICAAALLLLTDLSLDAARDAAAEGNLERAADAANDAIDVQPWASEPREELALVLEAQGDLAGARAAVDEAIDRAPEDWELWLLAARIELELGDRAAAREAVLEAQRLAPRLDPLARPAEEILDRLG